MSEVAKRLIDSMLEGLKSRSGNAQDEYTWEDEPTTVFEPTDKTELIVGYFKSDES